jgi:hypothetical protein
MARELSNLELDDLLGAFALDAVGGDERGQVEEYLRPVREFLITEEQAGGVATTVNPAIVRGSTD